MPTLIWLACVSIAWAPAAGPVIGYSVELGGAAPFIVESPPLETCFPDTYTPTTFRVQAFDAAGEVGSWSDSLTVERRHRFDADGSGVVGMPDFGLFVGAFGEEYLPSGIIK